MHRRCSGSCDDDVMKMSSSNFKHDEPAEKSDIFHLVISHLSININIFSFIIRSNNNTNIIHTLLK